MTSTQEALWQHLSSVLDRMQQTPTDHDLTHIVACLQPPQTPYSREQAALLVNAINHPVLHARIQRDELPGAIKTVLEDNVTRLMPRLGLRVVGPLVKLTHETQRVFGAEARKFDLVSARVAQLDADAQINTLTAYLQTKPAPLFCDLMAARFEDTWPEALAGLEDHKHLKLFRDQTDLVRALRSSDVDAHALRAHLDDATTAIDDAGWRHRLPLALDSANDDDRLVAAALACYWNEVGLSANVLEHFLAAKEDSAIIAVIAAMMEPMMAKQVFSLFLIDMSLGNAEEPEYQLNDVRIKLILAARWLLPHLGSPIDDDQIEALKASGKEMILKTLEHIEKSWLAWVTIKGDVLQEA